MSFCVVLCKDVGVQTALAGVFTQLRLLVAVEGDHEEAMLLYVFFPCLVCCEIQAPPQKKEADSSSESPPEVGSLIKFALHF